VAGAAPFKIPTLEQGAQPCDERRRPVAEIEQRAFPDLAAVAIALAQEDGGGRIAVGDGGGPTESSNLFAEIHGSRSDLFARVQDGPETRTLHDAEPPIAIDGKRSK
jgi:hypothetical protein